MTRNYSLLSENINNYNSSFSLMKNQLNATSKNETVEFIFDLNENVKTLKKKLNNYFEMKTN